LSTTTAYLLQHAHNLEMLWVTVKSERQTSWSSGLMYRCRTVFVVGSFPRVRGVSQ
jgi:hypothetical protein